MRSGGFTLIEIVVVLLILGVVAAVSVPALRSLEESRSPSEQAARELAGLLRESRQAALDRGRAVTLTVDPLQRSYRIEIEEGVSGDGAERSPMVMEADLGLPPEVGFVGGSMPHRFRFDRLGSGHGPTIHLEGGDGSRAVIGVAPWTGEPRVEAREPARE